MTRRRLGVIGWPIAHSLSPAMHGAALAALGLDWEYLALAVPPEQLAEALRTATDEGTLGWNVTIPHKEAALALCRPDEQAARVGAVNTLCFDGSGPPRGLNTDLHGFRMLLAETGVVAEGARVALLGAGGAARAVAIALLDLGAAPTVVTRSPRRMRLPGLPDLPHLPWDPDALAALLQAVDLLVDATPRGLDPGAPALDLAPLPDHATVIDLVVRRTTPLTDAAHARGLRAATGTAMLLHQGARSLEAWTARPAPLDAMRRALDAAM
ncbi:MAG: shikimate dehydrogenase [Myxococcales bacterium]|nr:shikimate dehydrogenase [Myxococcales bacterium]